MVISGQKERNMLTNNQTNEKLLLVVKQMKNGYQQPNKIKMVINSQKE